MKHISKTFVRQHERSDCGVACLASIVEFHGGECSLENLRKISGTSKQGTTLLGLMHAAKQLGFASEGLEAERVENLKELNEPAILHVVIDERIQHYLVYYPQFIEASRSSDVYLLGDPAKGIIEMRAAELDKIWKSKALLKLTLTEKFVHVKEKKTRKKQWIIGLIKDDFNILLISFFLGMVISLLSVSTAIFSQRLIDDFLPKENTYKLVLSLAMVTMLLLARSGLGYLRGVFMIRQGMDFNNRIIQNFYGNLLALPKSFFDTRKIGEIVARMNDTRRIQSVFSTISGNIIIDLLLLLGSLGFVFAYSSTVGLIVLTGLPIYFFILYWFNNPVIHAQKEVMSGYALAEGNFIDTIQGVADIKLHNKQNFFKRQNATTYSEFQKRIASLGKLNIKFGLASDATGVILLMAIFGVTSFLVLSKGLRIGEMVALLGIVGGAIPAVNRLIVANVQIQEAMVAFDRMYEFSSMENEPITQANNEVLASDVNVVNVSFRFPGRRPILKDISMNIRRGEMLALLGESGEGKSTLLQLLQKFYQPETGAILIGDCDLESLNTNLWRENACAVPQDLKIFNGNLLYNITLSDSREDFQRAIAFCEEKGFSKYFNEFPQSYLTQLGEEGINISGGQKQLVSLARALFRKPKFLFLDEPTSALDRNTENFVLALLQKEKEDMAILMVTHRVKTAQRCDRIAVLEDGVIVACGTTIELLNSDNFFSASYREIISI